MIPLHFPNRYAQIDEMGYLKFFETQEKRLLFYRDLEIGVHQKVRNVIQTYPTKSSKLFFLTANEIFCYKLSADLTGNQFFLSERESVKLPSKNLIDFIFFEIGEKHEAIYVLSPQEIYQICPKNLEVRTIITMPA